MLEIVTPEVDFGPKILVIGIGGGGNNAVDRMIEADLKGVTFVSVNTDLAVLNRNKAETKLQIGSKSLKGYGAGADPLLGELAAEECEEEIRAIIADADMVIITCGMGGGTGTGAAPFVAKCCKDEGILTLGVVTIPFSFENKPRMVAAQSGLIKLKENVDTLLVIPNDKLLKNADRQLRIQDAFVLADSVLRYAIEGITNIVYNVGTVNIDFNDLKAALTKKGIGHLGIGTVDKENSILEAVKQAINSPLLDTSIEGAETILLNTSGDVAILELNEAVNYVREIAGDEVNIIWGTVENKNASSENEIVVTLIATGMPESKPMEKETLGAGQLKAGNAAVNFNTSKKVGINERLSTEKEIHLVVPDFLKNYDKRK